MVTLPQLLPEDMQQIDDVLLDLLRQSEATVAVLIDKGGFLIAHQGDARKLDLTTIAALASGAYLANQTIANLIQETDFNSVYQQGEVSSIFTSCVDEHCLLVVIFPARLGVGIVKYYTVPSGEKIADQLQTAKRRNPGGGLDLSVMNMGDTETFFRRGA